MSVRLAASYRDSWIVQVRLATGVALALVLLSGCAADEPSAQTSSQSPSATLPTDAPSGTDGPTGTAVPPTPEGNEIDISELELGNCFAEPSGDLVERLIRLDCAGPHDAEVYAVVDLPPSPTYPGDDAVEAQADQVCTDASTAIDDSLLPGSATIGYFFPAEENWSSDDATALCYIATDDEPLVGSVRR
ncbi:MAG: septum formation family protein [Sporichthyaceae bacterium]|nr:septum formation family protein [Sporichthyaceae bacterium]